MHLSRSHCHPVLGLLKAALIPDGFLHTLCYITSGIPSIEIYETLIYTLLVRIIPWVICLGIICGAFNSSGSSVKERRLRNTVFKEKTFYFDCGERLMGLAKARKNTTTEASRAIAQEGKLPYYSPEQIEAYAKILENAGFKDLKKNKLYELLQKLAERPTGPNGLKGIKGELATGLEIPKTDPRMSRVLKSTEAWLRDLMAFQLGLPMVKPNRDIVSQMGGMKGSMQDLSLSEVQGARKMAQKDVEFLYIGDENVGSALEMGANEKACDLVGLSQRRNTFHLGEVKASVGTGGADLKSAIGQLKNTAEKIRKKISDATFETLTVYLPENAAINGDYVLKGDTIFQYILKGEKRLLEPVKIYGKVVRVVRFP